MDNDVKMNDVHNNTLDSDAPNPIILALYASLFTWGGTALGAALVFVIPKATRKLLDISLGFAAGIMMAASFWSLLLPAVEAAKLSVENEHLAFISVTIGLILGIAFVFATEKCLPDDLSITPTISRKSSKCKDFDNNDIDVTRKLDDPRNCELVKNNSHSSSIEIDVTHQTQDSCTYQYRITSPPLKDSIESSNKVCYENLENAQSVRRIFLLVIVIMVHNIPEGLAGGVAFGSIGQIPTATIENAFKLAIAIALHNFPEGLAVALPLVGFGWPKWKAFVLGQFSGMVEPLATMPAAFGVMLLRPILPYAYSFAAGSMIYVVFDDIMPETQLHGNGRMAAMAAMVGFIIMMVLEIGFA